MDIWEVNKLLLFLLFFIPGFVSIKIYDLIIPGEQRDFSKSFVEVVGYSALNYAAFSWLIILVYLGDFYSENRAWLIFPILLVVFIAPICWPVILTRLWKWRPLAKHIINPVKKPWDYVFGQSRHYWVIVHLKDGRKIGGRFDTESFASSFPAKNSYI